MCTGAPPIRALACVWVRPQKSDLTNHGEFTSIYRPSFELEVER